MVVTEELSPSRIEEFAKSYCEQFNAPSDDPFDDYFRILSVLKISEFPPFPKKTRSGYDAMLEAMSNYAEIVCPRLNATQWRSLLSAIFSLKYGGTRVRIKKKPADAVKSAAKSLTPGELMQQFGISRAYAYRLRSAALKS